MAGQANDQISYHSLAVRAISQFQPPLPVPPPPFVCVDGDRLILFLPPRSPTDLAMQAGKFAHMQPPLLVDLLLKGEALLPLSVDKGLPLLGIA